MKLQLPVIQGLIDRRMLVNFRVSPDVIGRLLPGPFQPRLIHGYAMAGICLIRLREIRPHGWPAILGIASENAAHRIAVTWENHNGKQEGVFIPRRDTSSHLNAFVGGRLFPGVHHRSLFDVQEANDKFTISIKDATGSPLLSVSARLARELTKGSIFGSLEEASKFFERGSVGYSVTRQPGEFDGLELRTSGWRMEPLDVVSWQSCYFSDTGKFPNGAVQFDSAFLMRKIPHEWHNLPAIKTHHE